MKASLVGCWLKQRRALTHLGRIKAETENFYKATPPPFELAEVLNPTTGSYRLLLVKVTPAKKEWSLLIGELIHNLRSSLDHMIWQLAIGNGKTPDPFPLPRGSKWRNLQFPIFLSKPEFDKNTWRIEWALSDKAMRFVERVQPFDAPNHPLWWLGELSNIDKHRTLTLTSSYLHKVTIHRPHGTYVTVHSIRESGFLETKTEIAHATLTPPPKNLPRIGGAQILVVFGRGMGPVEGRWVVTTLSQVGTAAEKVLREARRHI